MSHCPLGFSKLCWKLYNVWTDSSEALHDGAIAWQSSEDVLIRCFPSWNLVTVGISSQAVSPSWPQPLLYETEETTNLLQPFSSQRWVNAWCSNDILGGVSLLRVIHGRQETVLTAAGPSENTNRKAGPAWFIFFDGITWCEREMTWGKGREQRPADNNMYSVFFMCVSGSDLQYVSSGLHVFLCKSKKTIGRQWRRSEGKGLEEWSQTGISRKWRLAKQEQRDCAAPLYSLALALP